MPSEVMRDLFGALGMDSVPYRPVLDRQGVLVIPGVEVCDADLVAAFDRLPLAGRRVADLGCNVGFFSFRAAKLGAAYVTGWDGDHRLIEACRLLQAHYGLTAMEFQVADLDDPAVRPRPTEVALLMDMIGVECARRGHIDSRLNWLRRADPEEAVVSLREIVPAKTDRIRRELSTRYAGHMTPDGFRLADYVRDQLADRWSPVAEQPASYGGRRLLLRFRRRRPSISPSPNRQLDQAS